MKQEHFLALLALITVTAVLGPSLCHGHAWHFPRTKVQHGSDHSHADDLHHGHGGARIPLPASFECDACQYVVSIVQEYVKVNKSMGQTAFHALTDDICLQYFDVWIAAYCMYVMDENALTLYDIVVNHEKGDKACKELGLCSSKDNPSVSEYKKKSNVINTPDDIVDDTIEGETFNFAILSDTHIGQASNTEYITWLTKVAIDKINGMIEKENIKLVFITGDITDSARPWQWSAAKELYDQLKVPYWPTFGNHDVWTYNNTGPRWQEPYPTGDAQFAHTFKDRFLYPNLTGAEIVYNNQSCHNPVHNITSWFQNWELRYKGLVFIGLDWNSRDAAAFGAPGAWPGAALQDYPGGTFPWLKSRLRAAPRDSTNVVLLQHHPFAMPYFLPEAIYSFPEPSVNRIQQLLQDDGAGLKFWGLLAGHLHVWYDGPGLPNTSKLQNFRQWLTEGTKVSSAFTLVKVRNGQVAELQRMYGFDY